MPSIEHRLAALEDGGSFGPDGRDPALVEMLRELMPRCGLTFDVRQVPVGVSQRAWWRDVLAVVSNRPGSRCIDLIEPQKEGTC